METTENNIAGEQTRRNWVVVEPDRKNGYVRSVVELNPDGTQGRSVADRLTKADATWVSASPDLLEAAKAMLKLTGGSSLWTGETEVALRKMEEAVQKAESR